MTRHNTEPFFFARTVYMIKLNLEFHLVTPEIRFPARNNGVKMIITALFVFGLLLLYNIKTTRPTHFEIIEYELYILSCRNVKSLSQTCFYIKI